MNLEKEKLKIFSFRPDAGIIKILEENEKLEVAGGQFYLTLSNKIRLAIKEEEQRTDWREAADRVAALGRREGMLERSIPSTMQVRLREDEAEKLETLFASIKASLHLTKPRLNYLFKIILEQRNIELSRERVSVGSEESSMDMTASELVGELVEMILQEPHAGELEDIKNIVLKWRRRRGFH